MKKLFIFIAISSIILSCNQNEATIPKEATPVKFQILDKFKKATTMPFNDTTVMIFKHDYQFTPYYLPINPQLSSAILDFEKNVYFSVELPRTDIQTNIIFEGIFKYNNDVFIKYKIVTGKKLPEKYSPFSIAYIAKDSILNNFRFISE